MKTRTFLFLLVIGQALCAQRLNNAQQIIDKLTTEEKVALVVGAGVDMTWLGEPAPAVPIIEKVPGAAGNSQTIPSLDIPAIVFSDGPAGVRINPTRANDPNKTFYATAFPVATLLASSFNEEVLENVGAAFGDECKEYGVDVLLAPALNIHRSPLGGRNFEYYSEDPVVAGKMAAAFTNGVQAQGVGVSIKHFAANNQETNRTQINTIVSERAMREIYLKGFEIAVKESNPWTVMSSYNEINGVYTSENHDLLTTILREEWGFKGFVMTDWFAGKDAVAQVQAGNDLLMPGTPKQTKEILAGIKDGTLSMEDLNRNVTHILNIYLNTLSYKNNVPSNTPQLQLHKAVAREAASEGMILLKNNKNALPLKPESNVALFGIGSYMTIAGGTGSGDVNKAYMVTISEGLQKTGVALNPTVTQGYDKYIAEQKAIVKPKANFFMPDVPFEEMTWTDEQLNTIAQTSSIGVFTLLRTSGEGSDRNVQNDFNLKPSEKQAISQLCKAFHKQNKPVVIMLNIGGVIETASWKDEPDAILVVWQPGQEGGYAVSDILTGKVNPSGKLPMTFPINYNDAYSAKNFPGKLIDPTKPVHPFFGAPAEVTYEEDIYVGYRYFDSFQVPTSYPFGFGLSYTNFTISDLKTEKLANGTVKVNCTITNAGKTAGKEVVQLYSAAPKGKLNKPSKELKCFEKTILLNPGQKQDIEFTITPYQLSSYDTENSQWIMEKGDYKLLVGTSSENLPLSATINQSATTVVLKANKVLTPKVAISVLK